MKIFVAYIIFLVSLAILVSLSILYTQRFRELTRYNDEVDQTHMVIIQLNNLLSYLKDAETGERGFLLSGDSTFLHPYYDAMDSIKPTFQRLYDMIGEHQEQRQKLDALNILMNERLEVMDHSMLMFTYNPSTFQKTLHRGRQKMNECRAMIKEITEDQYRFLANNRKTKEFYELVTPGFFLILIGFTAIAFILSFYVIIREYTSRLKYQKDLEQKITALDQSYKELEQIAYIASHDLQEPLRKISTFCDRLVMKHRGRIDDEGRLIIDRINHSAIRVRELVEILAHYTALATDSKKKEPVDLNMMFNLLTNKFREQFDKKNALLQLQGLSTVQGYPDQLRLLFECLIDNSLKFSKDSQSLVINISKQHLLESDPETARSQCAFKIVYRDNGIGFDNEFAEKIFSMFRRLQTSSEGDGKGIGLSIVKRVMTNHSGFVLARGKPSEGAEFVLYFPDN